MPDDFSPIVLNLKKNRVWDIELLALVSILAASFNHQFNFQL
jgi:hypothetical protein